MEPSVPHQTALNESQLDPDQVVKESFEHWALPSSRALSLEGYMWSELLVFVGTIKSLVQNYKL